MKIIVYRGINDILETEKALKGIPIGSWYSTEISDALAFAQKTKGIVIKCSIVLKDEFKGDYVTTLESKDNHSGWGVRDFDAKFADGFWYYIDSSYLENVSLLEVYTFKETMDLEEEIYKKQFS